MFGFPNEDPISKWDGYIKTCKVRLYATGRLIYRDNYGGDIVECNIHDISSISLISGGWGESRVQINGNGTALGVTKALPTDWAQDLKQWIDNNRSLMVQDEPEHDSPSTVSHESNPDGQSPIELLKGLKELKDLGIIDEAEYQEKRQKYLDLL